MKMSRNKFIKGILAGAGMVIGLLVVLFLAMPYIYSQTENRNFAKLRKKSALNCETMPLHCLVRDENREGISAYIRSGRDLELADNWGKTALFWAFDKGKYDIAKNLLALEANPNTKDHRGISIFHQAVVWGKYDFANELLAGGANIDAFNGNRYPETTLHYCVMKNKPECVLYLVEHGANKYLKDSFGYTVFERIQVHDHISKEIGMLLEK